MTNLERDDLEQLIDRNGLDTVLDAISIICAAKAEHIRTNWQDKELARNWTKVSNLTDGLVSRVLDLQL